MINMISIIVPSDTEYLLFSRKRAVVLAY